MSNDPAANLIAYLRRLPGLPESTRAAVIRGVEEGRAAKARDRALAERAERVAVSDMAPEAKESELERIRRERLRNIDRATLREILRAGDEQ